MTAHTLAARSLFVGCRAAATLAILVAAARPLGAQRNVREVSVGAGQPWTATGVYVRRGDAVAFSASGEVQLSGNPEDVAHPAGSLSGRVAPRAPLRDAPAGALIGRVGTSRPFGIGDQTQPLDMPDTGEIFLGINDDAFADNRGAFTVVIRGGTAGRPGRTDPPPAPDVGLPAGRGLAVAANRQWTPTGRYVRHDDFVTFRAGGQIRLSRDEDDLASPAGSLQGRYNRYAPLPNVLEGALIGRVGDSEPFGIGDQTRPLRMPATGELLLGINSDYVRANSGQFTVEVQGGSTRPIDDTRGSSDSARIRVRADEPWTSTGLTVRSGDRLDFSVRGEIRLSNRGRDVGPEGDRQNAGWGAPIPRAPLGLLIGRIDNGPPFEIGDDPTMRVRESGRLFLGVNDANTVDNRGEFRVDIERRR